MNLDQDKTFQAMLMSDTLPKLQQLSQAMSTNIKNPGELHMVFAATSVELIKALDGDRIKFDDSESYGMFHALLAVVVDYVMDGRLRDATQKNSIN